MLYMLMMVLQDMRMPLQCYNARMLNQQRNLPMEFGLVVSLSLSLCPYPSNWSALPVPFG